MSTTYQVRSAQETDIPRIHNIFAHYVINTALSFRVSPPSESFMRSKYNATISAGLPFLVALDSTNTVIGYAHASTFQAGKHAYGHSVEVTIFCDPEHTKRGVGSALMQELLERLKQSRHVSVEVGYEDSQQEYLVRKVLAIMAVDETTEGKGLSLRDWYVKKWGFEEVGRLKGVGEKSGRDSIDTIYLEKHLQ